MPRPKKSDPAFKAWETRRALYGPSGRSYHKRAPKYRRRNNRKV